MYMYMYMYVQYMYIHLCIYAHCECILIYTHTMAQWYGGHGPGLREGLPAAEGPHHTVHEQPCLSGCRGSQAAHQTLLPEEGDCARVQTGTYM